MTISTRLEKPVRFHFPLFLYLRQERIVFIQEGLRTTRAILWNPAILSGVFGDDICSDQSIWFPWQPVSLACPPPQSKSGGYRPYEPTNGPGSCLLAIARVVWRYHWNWRPAKGWSRSEKGCLYPCSRFNVFPSITARYLSFRQDNSGFIQEGCELYFSGI